MVCANGLCVFRRWCSSCGGHRSEYTTAFYSVLTLFIVPGVSTGLSPMCTLSNHTRSSTSSNISIL
jgi:hypothetical protein